MVNANEKWEPVEAEALRLGDKVRVTHPVGDVVVGTAEVAGPHRKLLIEGWLGAEIWPHQWARGALTFERAVPERTLPTEPGVYVSASQYQAGDYDIFTLGAIAMTHGWAHTNKVGKTQRADEVFLPDDLVRLVPVTEVEASEKRNHEAWNALEDYRRIGGQRVQGLISDVQKILDGRSKP